MQRRNLIGLAALVLLVLPASAQDNPDNLNWKPPMRIGGADYLDSSQLFEAGLVKHWQLQLPLGPGQQIIDSFLVDDQLYFGTADGYVFAVHAPTGALRWVRPFTRGGYRLRKPAHVGIRTVIATPPSMVHYDRQYGKPLARTQLRFPSGTAPISDGISVLLGGLNRRMYSFEAETGYERWKIGADAQLVSGPAIFDEALYFASDEGTVYACTANNKRFQWINRSLGPVKADLVVDENGVYVASRDRSLYLLDPAFGGTRWRVRFSSALNEAPVTTPDMAFQYTDTDGLVAIDAKAVNVESRVKWKLANGRKLLTVDETTAYVLTTDGKVVACDLESGAIKHEVAATGFDQAMSFTKLPVLYLASPDGRVFAARKRGTRVITADAVVAAMEVPKEEKPAVLEDEEQAERAILTREEVLGTRQGGPAIGGKSKVTREFQEQQQEQPNP